MKRSIQLGFLLYALMICTESYAQLHYVEYPVPSGRKVKIMTVGPVFNLSGSKDKTLKMQYLSDFKVDDKFNVAKEVGDIWVRFRQDVEKGGYTAAVISAVEASKSGSFGITQSRTYDFVFLKDQAGNWHCDNDRTIEIPDLLYRKAMSLLQRGQYRQAIPSLNELIVLWPNSAEAYNNRATTYLVLHDPKRALADMDKSISLNANDARSYNNRGAAYGELGDQDKEPADFDKALADINKALVLDSQYDMAYINRGEIFLRVNKLQEAVKDLSAAIGKNPTIGEAYFYRAQAYRKLGNNVAAQKDLEKAKTLNYREGMDTVSGTQ